MRSRGPTASAWLTRIGPLPPRATAKRRTSHHNASIANTTANTGTAKASNTPSLPTTGADAAGGAEVGAASDAIGNIHANPDSHASLHEIFFMASSTFPRWILPDTQGFCMIKSAQASRNRHGPDAQVELLRACARLVEALPLACALFDDAGAGVAFGTEFTREFPQLGASPRLRDFEDIFEPADDGEPAQIRKARDSGRHYALAGRRLDGLLPGATFAVATPLARDNEALRDHRARQERLFATSRMMSVGEMTTTLAHELNQPLASIINYLGACSLLLEQGDTGNPRLQQGITLARGQASRASEVIARLREFVRTREPKRSPQAPHALVGAVLELVQADAAQQRIGITTEVAADLPDVFADRVMIEQVLLNLLKNAIDAMREVPATNRKLRIDAEIDLDGMLRFRVSDRGCGLGEEGAAQLFTPLYTTKADGLGMGLAICRSIIEYHAGRLYAEANPGGGSVFVFTLPVVETAAREET